MLWSLISWFQSPYLLVAMGGAIGSTLRYGVGRLFASPNANIPSLWATATVNLLGSFVLGCVVMGVSAHQRGHPAVLLLGVGLCGGFTTFSTLAMELADLINARRWDVAMAYGLGSLVLGWLAFISGAWVIQRCTS